MGGMFIFKIILGASQTAFLFGGRVIRAVRRTARKENLFT